MTLILTQQAVLFHRPEFTQEQAKSMIGTMLEDLAEFEVSDIEEAARAWRNDPTSRFFPTSGQLRFHANKARKERAERADWNLRGSYARPEFGESRPLRWWDQPQKFWRSNWHERDIPEDERATYFAIKAKREARQ